METALRSRLLADGPVAALVGERVDWTVRPQGAPLPAIVLTLISDERAQDYKGFIGVWRTRVQIDAYGADRAEVVAVREAAIAAITPAGTFFGTKFLRAFIDTVRDLSADIGTDFIHRDSFDAFVWHN